MEKCLLCEEELTEEKKVKCSICSIYCCSISCLLDHYTIHEYIKPENNSDNLLKNLKRKQLSNLTEKFFFLTPGTFLEKSKFDDNYNIENIEIINQGFFPYELGKGSFGRIYLGKNKINNELCAIKKINKRQLYRIYGNYNIINNEISIHSRCIHQNIIRLYNISEDENYFNLILEYAPNGTLYDKIKKEKKFDEKTSHNYFIQILNAVCFLHSNNIIHRDIKPENILIDKKGNLKLCDFGWSKEIFLENRSTYCGTIEYMAPEILESKNYDFGVDIWSLGIFLYEMIIGYSPFYSKDNKNIKINIKEHKIKFNENFSPCCRDLIKKILNGNLEKRFKLKDICNHPFIINNLDYFEFGVVETENMDKENHKININKRKRSFSLKSLFSQNKIEILKDNLNFQIEKAKNEIKSFDFQNQNFEVFENIKKKTNKKKLNKNKLIPNCKNKSNIN